MVCKFGMSEKLGPVRYGSRSEHIYLGKDITRSQEYSEETAREIDLEVKALVTAAKAKATDILTREKARMDLLAETLLEKETLSAAEVRILLDLPAPEKDTEETKEETASGVEGSSESTEQPLA